MSDTDAGFTVTNHRQLAFPKAAVLNAFTDPAKLKVWWGPDGFTNEIDHFDLRPGGRWLFTMINESGKRFDNVKEFTEVTPARIVFRHLEPMHDFVMTMTFDEAGDACDLGWEMVFAPGSNPDLAVFIESANEQNFDRLQAFLEQNL